MTDLCGGGIPFGVEVKVMCYVIVISQFELQ